MLEYLLCCDDLCDDLHDFIGIGSLLWVIIDAPHNQVHEWVVTSNLLKEYSPSFGFRDWYHFAPFHTNLTTLWLWPLPS